MFNSTKKPKQGVKEDINWNTAFRSYSPSSSSNNNKSSTAHDKEITLEPQASDSEDSLNLCVPSKMANPTPKPKQQEWTRETDILAALDDMSTYSEEEEENARNASSPSPAMMVKREIARDDNDDDDDEPSEVRDCGLPDPVIEFELNGEIFDFTEKVSNVILVSYI